jgi:hypothetical protein
VRRDARQATALGIIRTLSQGCGINSAPWKLIGHVPPNYLGPVAIN